MKLVVTIALTVLLPAAAGAGEIYGKITAGGKAVAEGTEVAAKCGARTYPATRTDKAGGYHLVVQETGKCTLSITQKEGTASVEVVSYDEAAQADVVVESKDGKLAARRR